MRCHSYDISRIFACFEIKILIMRQKDVRVPVNVEEYLASFPEDLREKGEQVRSTIRKAAPAAEEIISYQMPAYRLNGIVVYFAIHTGHIGFYPASLSVGNLFEERISSFERSRGTIRFPHNRPIPLDLIADIVAFRVLENLGKPARNRK